MHKPAAEEVRDQLRHWIPPGSAVAIMDVPVHRNAGDLFILATTEKLLRDLGCSVVYRTSLRDYTPARAHQRIDRDTILIGLGGGNFGDLYPEYQAHRERIVREFAGNRIVILPHTLHYRHDHALARTVSVFERHPDVRIAVRDHGSLALARRMTGHVLLLPDLVDVFGERADPPPPGAGQVRTLTLTRRDREGHRERSHDAGAVDWIQVLPGFYRRLLVARLLMPLAPSPLSDRLHAWWRTYADAALRAGLDVMARADHVVTDRLHGAILARLAGRTVTLCDRGYGKLTAYYETWWTDDPAIELRAS